MQAAGPTPSLSGATHGAAPSPAARCRRGPRSRWLAARRGWALCGRWLLAGLLAGLSAGCSLQPPAGGPTPPRLPAVPLADALFGPPDEPVDAAALLAISPAMRQFLADQLPERRLRRMAEDTPERLLAQALYRNDALQLRYEEGLTRGAAQAFEARAGNCLSLVLMTTAFARALGVPVAFRQVAVALDDDEAWRRQGDLLLHSDHVQVVLGAEREQRTALGGGISWREPLVIDFLPSTQAARLRSTPLSEARLLAMVQNNRAAEALAAGRLASAYAWARAALRQQPGWSRPALTLAAIYLRAGQPALAETTLRAVLAAEPDHPLAAANLVPVLQAQGRGAEAAGWQARLLVRQRRWAEAAAQLQQAQALAASTAEREAWAAKLQWLQAQASPR